MARPKKTTEQKRILKRISFGINANEMNFLKSECADTGLNQSDYIRDKIFKNKMKVVITSKLDIDSGKHIIKAGGNLNQLITVINTKIKIGEKESRFFNEILTEIQEALKDIRAIREKIL